MNLFVVLRVIVGAATVLVVTGTCAQAHDVVVPLQRRGLLDTLKDRLNVGGKQGRNDRAMAKIQSGDKHVTAKTLNRLNSDNFARVAPEHMSAMQPKEAFKVGKVLDKHITKHSTALAGKMNQMNHQPYTDAHYAGVKKEPEMRKIVTDRFKSKPETKLTIHEDAQKHQSKLDRLEPALNVHGAKAVKADEARHVADKSKHPSNRQIDKAHQRQVDMRGKLDPQFKVNALHHQGQVVAQGRQKLAENHKDRSDPFSEHPHRTPDASTRDASSHGGGAQLGNRGNAHTYRFEGKEKHAALNDKLSPTYAYGDRFRGRPASAAATQHSNPEAKTTPTLIRGTRGGSQSGTAAHQGLSQAPSFSSYSRAQSPASSSHAASRSGSSTSSH